MDVFQAGSNSGASGNAQPEIAIIAMLPGDSPSTGAPQSQGSGNSLTSILGQIVDALLAYEQPDSISQSSGPDSGYGGGGPQGGYPSGSGGLMQPSGTGLIDQALLQGLADLAHMAGMQGGSHGSPFPQLSGPEPYEPPSSQPPAFESPSGRDRSSGCGPNGYSPRSANYEPFRNMGPGGVRGTPMTSLPCENGSLSGKPQTWQTHASSGKQQVNDALDKAGATPQEKALIMAMGAQETNDFQSSEHDRSKDGTDSANYSAFNLNPYELRKFGYKGDLNALNDQSNIGQAAVTLLHGMRQYGADNVMDLTRDGQSGENKANDPSLEQWRRGQVDSAKEYLQLGPQSMVDNTRIAAPANYQ